MNDEMTARKAARAGQAIQSFAARSAQMAAWCDGQSNESIESWWAAHDDALQALRGPCRDAPYRGRFIICELENDTGPTSWDPSVTGIVCSAETLSACERINTTREEKGLPRMEIISLPLALDPSSGQKMSSTALRAAAAASKQGGAIP